MEEIRIIKTGYSNFDYFMMFVFLSPIFILTIVFAVYVFEIIYQRKFKKPFLVFTQVFNKKLNEFDKKLLEENVVFYQKLKPKYKVFFEHRVVNFLEKTNFSGKDILVTNEIKINIAAVYIQLTFGMKHYLNKLINEIIVYPNAYLSSFTNKIHKGEFNPKLKTIVFSWEDFQKGIEDPNDNLNLGFHEFTHALHFSTLKSDMPSHVLFNETLQSLFVLFSSDLALRENMLTSGFFRDYAYENQYEFVAVLLEHFFESPQEMKQNFPIIYQKVKQMINFNENLFLVN